jgi:hypothetical protein
MKAGRVQCSGSAAAAFRHVAEGQHQHRQHEGDIHQEGMAPRQVLDQEAARHQQRAADALQGARPDQLADRLRQPASAGGGAEHQHAAGKHAAPAIAVAHGAAEQQQGAQEQGIGFDHPLHLATPVSNAPCSAGRATLTTVPSMKTMPDARMLLASTQGRARGAHKTASCPAGGEIEVYWRRMAHCRLQ